MSLNPNILAKSRARAQVGYNALMDIGVARELVEFARGMFYCFDIGNPFHKIVYIVD